LHSTGAPALGTLTITPTSAYMEAQAIAFVAIRNLSKESAATSLEREAQDAAF
jgi:hypothetical protein